MNYIILFARIAWENAITMLLLMLVHDNDDKTD